MGVLFLDLHDVYVTSDYLLREPMFTYERRWSCHLHLSELGAQALARAIRDWLGDVLRGKLQFFSRGYRQERKKADSMAWNNAVQLTYYQPNNESNTCGTNHRIKYPT